MEFVTFEIAKKLKEKGFLQSPDYFNYSSYYDWDGFEKKYTHYLSQVLWFDSNISRNNLYFAPAISQVLKWLRKEKEIDIVIYPIDGSTVFMGREKYILSVYINKKRDYKLHHDNIDKYVEWEQAALAGIEYCLENLI